MPKQVSIMGHKEFIALMAILMSVVAISIDALLPALGIIGRDLQVSHPNQAQYVISAIFIGLALGQLISGPLSDALGRKKVLFIGLSLYLLGSVICISADGIETMLVGRFIQGLGVAGPYLSVMSIVRDKYSGTAMARIMSLVMMVFMMVPILAPALGQLILFVANWKGIFAVYIFYAICVATWAFWRLEETLRPENTVPFKISNIVKGTMTVLTNKTTLCYTLAIGFIFGALIGDLNSIQQIFQGKYAVGDLFAVYFGLQALAFGVASFTNSHLVERLGMRRLCLTGAATIVTASIALFIYSCFMSPPFALFFVYGVVILFCFGIMFGNLNAIALEPMGHIAGLASAIVGATSSIIGIVLGTIIGQLYDGTLNPLILGFLILGSLAFIMMYVEKSAHTRQQSAELAEEQAS
ncbi:multidrug effflux MFS transporter [Neptunicella sp. SCSIO 80796]|uniref:multidrug effflux MFS transporter n=1 Tax=Neptunicella plasticusilytica TaxID=3117012 RepID=UPI003A4E2D58